MNEDLKVYTKPEANELKLDADSLFETCEFQGIDFSAYDLKSVSFLDCKFTNCNFANQQLINVSMRDVVFELCNLMGINWCSLKRFESPKFYNSKLNFCTFQELRLKKIQISNCLANEADFSGADLSQSDFSGSGFSGANFDRSNLTGVDFRTSRDYIFDLRTAKIKGAKFTYPYVISLITALGTEVEI